MLTQVSPELVTAESASRGLVRNLLLDNDQVRVVETIAPAGVSVPMHDHPYPYVLYAISGGACEVTHADGTKESVQITPGVTLWRGPQQHSTYYPGPSTVRLVEVEVKQASATG